MEDRKTRILRTLAFVQSAGSLLEPSWDPTRHEGIAYRANGVTLEDDDAAAYLEELATQDYLESVFVERISLCPNCGSHALNVHEACLTCSSSNLIQFKALFHFRCGFVGPVTAFREEPQGRRCPKCSRLLKDLGTDYESPGDYFRCRVCTAMFQVPDVGARCLSCTARFSGDAMQTIAHRDAFAYRLTALGRAALRDNRPLDDPQEALQVDGMLERRHAILDRVDRARQRKNDGGGPFGAIVIALGNTSTGAMMQNLAVTIRRTVTDEFNMGRLDGQHAVVLVPNGSLTQAVHEKILSLYPSADDGVRAAVVDVPEGEAVGDALDYAARRLDLGT